MTESEIKTLLKRLGESINETLSNSPEVHERIREIRNAGYEIFLTVETRIGYCCANEESPNTGDGEDEQPTRLNYTEYDAKFLKTLKIAIS